MATYTDNGGYITIHEDRYPSSGPGPAKVPGAGTWGLGGHPRTVEEDVLAMRAGAQRPYFSRLVPGIPTTLGAVYGDCVDRIPGGEEELNGIF